MKITKVAPPAPPPVYHLELSDAELVTIRRALFNVSFPGHCGEADKLPATSLHANIRNEM